MTKRSRAREVVLQLLFQFDMNPRVPRSVIEQFVRDRLRHSKQVDFCLELYDGAVAHRQDVDAKLTAAAENWRLARMTVVDRNVLRLGAFELLYGVKIPAAVSLDEAIELARRFGSKDSPSFVNGVLDSINQLRGDPPESQPLQDPMSG
jgi:transcription antitermination protein NusB